jgi:predicted PurR-regulated permease PerM
MDAPGATAATSSRHQQASPAGHHSREGAVNEDRIRKAFLLFVVVGISALFFTMIRQFVMTLLMAGIFAGLTRPVYLRVLRAVRGRRPLASLATLLLLVVAVALPLFSLLGIVVQQALQFAQTAGPALRQILSDPSRLQARLAAIPGIDHLQPLLPRLAERGAEIASALGGFIAGWVSDATSSVLVFLLDGVILLYAMFFFYTDGPDHLRAILSYLPFSEDENGRLLARFLSVSRATLRGTLLIAIVQGTINGIGFWVVGLPAPAFWGAAMILLSLVPAVGGALVWVPTAAWLAISGQWWQAGVLLGICGGIAGTIDNLLRPRLVGRDTKLPDLLVLVSTLGGLGLFGIAGLVVGPLVAALFLTLWEILGEVYRPATEPPREEVQP